MSSWGWEVVVHMHRSPSCSTRDPWLLCARHPLNSPRIPHLTQGIHVVTPNKKLNSGPYPAWRAVKTLQAAGAAHYMYEGTVGAGLGGAAPLTVTDALGTAAATAASATPRQSKVPSGT